MPNHYVIPGGTQVEITHTDGKKSTLVMRDDLLLRNAEPTPGETLAFQVGQWHVLVPKDAVVVVDGNGGGSGQAGGVRDRRG